jgi:F0F1-type ATP synthase assembly protein I
MSKVQNNYDDSKSSEPSAVVLLAAIADTTWRMFVPIIGLLLVGRYIDQIYNSKPLGMIIGVVLGTLITGLLIGRLLKKG